MVGDGTTTQRGTEVASLWNWWFSSTIKGIHCKWTSDSSCMQELELERLELWAVYSRDPQSPPSPKYRSLQPYSLPVSSGVYGVRLKSQYYPCSECAAHKTEFLESSTYCPSSLTHWGISVYPAFLMCSPKCAGENPYVRKDSTLASFSKANERYSN